MTAKLDYQWNLRTLMAARGMFSTTDLRPLLVERGIALSPTQVWRLVTEKPERLNLKVLMALVDILGCPMDRLIEPIAIPAKRQRRAAGQSGPTEPSSDAEKGLGSLRPKRARIVPGE